ncbi:hypothetical protein HK101_001059 [Irineochytrium annulatum]|nr:hypothetical protein HK101_001059 [Irineochytrium annulatum]
MLCNFCNRKHCMAHRLPEVHAEACAAKMRDQASASHRADGKLFIGLNAKEGGKKEGNVEKERAKARERLAEKIKAAKSGRSKH